MAFNANRKVERQKRPEIACYVPPSHPSRSSVSSAHTEKPLSKNDVDNSRNIYNVPVKDVHTLSKENSDTGINTRFDVLKTFVYEKERFDKMKPPSKSVTRGDVDKDDKRFSSSSNREFMHRKDCLYDPPNDVREVTPIEELNYVLEAYDFPDHYSEEDLARPFCRRVGAREVFVRWIDSSHAVIIFDSPESASAALTSVDALKLRPLSQASALTKERVKTMAIKPFKERPQTTSFLAHRLISNALGISVTSPEAKEKLEKERKKLADARESKIRTKTIKDAIWNGDVSIVDELSKLHL